MSFAPLIAPNIPPRFWHRWNSSVRRLAAGTGIAVLAGLGVFGRPADEPAPSTPGRFFSASASRFIDGLPAFVAERLPMFDPDGTVQVSVRPHLGDFFRPGYVRVPVGARWKITDRLELNGELNNYFSHGRAGATGVGVSGLELGLKCEHVLPTLAAGGFSVGIDYRTPFSDSPREFTDGFRHVQPYIAATRLIVPAWGLLGYGNIGANILERTSLPANFVRNQLHATSLAVATGVARNWTRFHASLTMRLASTALTSNEGRQNFQIRPEISFPLRQDLDARTQIFLTMGGRVMWGPEGRQVNSNGGMRVNFHFDRAHRSPSENDARFVL